MTSEFHVLIDSDAFVGRFYPDDAHHPRVVDLFAQLEAHQRSIVTTNFVVAETATVLSRLSGQSLATRFLDALEQGDFPVLWADEALYAAGMRLFREQQRSKTSFVDCLNVATMQHYHIPHILSFDHVYSKDFKLQPLSMAEAA